MERTTTQMNLQVLPVPAHWTTRQKKIILLSMGMCLLAYIFFPHFSQLRIDWLANPWHGESFYISLFNTEFDDFFITSIGGEAQTATQFWGILLNFQFTPVGGCQQEVKRDDEVLFAFDAFNKAHFLKLTGPNTAHVDTSVVLTVTDGQSGGIVEGADVNGKISDANGHVSLTFSRPGEQKIKAEKSDSIRSAQHTIFVI
jgi:hypothetical protein